jgi:putative sterol carrier protein
MSKVKEKEDLQNTVKKWVGPYNGKILQVITPDDGAQYIIVYKKAPWMSLHEGYYPSPDVIYKAKSETLLGIFTGEVNFKDTMKDGSLQVIGNAHESDPLANLILAAMMGAI